eukprot:5449633-Amphidinium_carterae.1
MFSVSSNCVLLRACGFLFTTCPGSALGKRTSTARLPSRHWLSPHANRHSQTSLPHTCREIIEQVGAYLPVIGFALNTSFTQSERGNDAEPHTNDGLMRLET